MNFESEPNIEKDAREYMEKLREAIEEGEQFAEPGDVNDEEYLGLLHEELKSAESWETEAKCG